MGFASERRAALIEIAIEIDIGSIAENLDNDPDPDFDFDFDFDRLERAALQKLDASAKMSGPQGSLAPTAPAILIRTAKGSAPSDA
jgi:hypothetical protein